MASIRSLLALAPLLLAGLFPPGLLLAQMPPRLYIVGQDLDSIRGYYESACCPVADGHTAYLDLYNLLSEQGGFGGLGLDLRGRPTDAEHDWGGGPVNAWKTANDFPGALAIGLSLTENDHPGAIDRLLAGAYDENIRHLGRFIGRLDLMVYLRVAYEFDGFWNLGYDNAPRYRTAYRRVVDVLRETGPRNVSFVWQSAASPLLGPAGGDHENLMQWYPGDDYVDWVGVSWFLRPGERPAVAMDALPSPPSTLVGNMLELAREKNKPLMIAEASPQGYDLARRTRANISPLWDGPAGEGVEHRSPKEIWQEWYAPLFEFMSVNGDVVRALAYINCHWDRQDLWDAPYEGGYWGDSRLQVSPYIAERFTAAIDAWRSRP